MEVNTRICRKCLLQDTPEEDMWQSIHEYIERLPEEDKVSKAVYETRLLACRGCDMLLAGMCRVCGCYVEMRAAMKVRACPGVLPKWEKDENRSYTII